VDALMTTEGAGIKTSPGRSQSEKEEDA